MNDATEFGGRGGGVKVKSVAVVVMFPTIRAVGGRDASFAASLDIKEV